jgi:hypothetical protein
MLEKPGTSAAGDRLIKPLDGDTVLRLELQTASCRKIAFLGNAGIAFPGDLPDARRWLDYALRAYMTSSPGFGGDPGS